ncbi:unnamed protein product, partial [Mesorhabditis belari]|uniref:Uncharacterized protein n=1 Tax=Mesorhabditis belari TaxID=2138241 RepID=A0AAF3F0E5_9BILA
MPRGRKAALQTTRIKRTRPRPVRTVITKGNLVELFDSLMDGDESIQQSYNFSVCVDTPSRKQARGLDAIFEEELSQDETGDISNASQHSVKKNQYMTQLQELNDQYDDESDFSLLIESENGIRMQIINGKLKPHPRQTKSRTPEKVEPFKQLDQNRPMPPPKVKKNETKQEMQAIPPTPIPESALRARLRQSLAFPDRMAITKRQIRETHEARMSARPSIAPRMGPFSIRDIIDKRLQLADEFGKAPITPPQRQTLSPQPMRPSMASLKEDDLSNILTAKKT